MALKKIEQVKKDRGFKLFDIIIYGAVLLTVAVLFIVLFTTRDTDSLTGVRITVRAQVVFEYEFGGSDPDAEEKDYNGVTVKAVSDENGITVTVISGDDKNVVYIDKEKKTAKMTGANCKGRQCMYFAEMEDNSDFIYCNPHSLKVEPLNKDLDSPDIKI